MMEDEVVRRRGWVSREEFLELAQMKQALVRVLKGEKPGILGTQGIKWNFTKFLVGRDGQVLKRFAPNDAPAAIRGEIEAALGG